MAKKELNPTSRIQELWNDYWHSSKWLLTLGVAPFVCFGISFCDYVVNMKP